MSISLLYNTEGVKKDMTPYESEQCITYTSGKIVTDRKFLHDLLDEFLDSFERAPERTNLTFRCCDLHK